MIRNMPVISTSALTRRFGDATAVDHLTLAIEGGAVFGMLGHNGAGKTTTVRLLNGVLAPSEGSISVLGFNPVTEGPQVRARTGVLTESPSLDERLTARRTLRLFADIYGVPREQVNRRADELLEMFGLAERADDKVGGFSKGMRQRMALARTILHKPEIIFLDEPTAALDPVATREVHQLIRDSAALEGRTVFLCTHNLYEAQRLCTHVAVLARGRLLAMGTPAELAAQYGGMQRVAIEVAPPQAAQAAALLGVLPGAPQVEMENRGSGLLHIQGLAAPAVPDAVAALVHAGLSVFEVVREEATLEDVYFALAGETPALESRESRVETAALAMEVPA
jgi:ABC-2 type transport system ATP-binding protein